MCPLPISAVSITAIPVFFRNKRWVGLRDGKVSFRREIVPFWVFTLAGLLLSTVLVALANRVSDSTLLVMAANLGGFGVLWVSDRKSHTSELQSLMRISYAVFCLKKKTKERKKRKDKKT